MLQMLIVDDENPVLESLVSAYDWSELGIDTVHKASSGAEALSVMATFPIDILLTDIRMPGMSGIELISRVRAEGRRTACIILSGYADFEYAKQAMINKSADYLLKPVSDEDLLGTVRRVIDKLRAEWEEISSVHKALYTLRENMPALKGSLLSELLLGRKYPAAELGRKLSLLEMPFRAGDDVCLLIIRPEEGFEVSDYDLSLLEYAVGNITEEIMSAQFHLWRCKDALDYLTVVLKRRNAEEVDAAGGVKLLERQAADIQKAIRTYLKAQASVSIGSWGTFPDDLPRLYEEAVSVLRKQSSERELFVTASAAAGTPSLKPLSALYEPPGLHYLFDGGRWSEAENKLETIFAEIQQREDRGGEFVREAYGFISSAYSYIAHKNGQWLSDITNDDVLPAMGRSSAWLSIDALRQWSLGMLNLIRKGMESEARDQRSALIKDIQAFIEQQLASDVSLNAIADRVNLHPVYLSKIYKSETGEGLSEYIHRVRIEKATYFLLHTDKKIYEIAELLGFPYTPYFIRKFKKHFGLTPQEFRDQQPGA